MSDLIERAKRKAAAAREAWGHMAEDSPTAVLLDDLVSEIERLYELAYIGEHHFDDLTFKARLEEQLVKNERLQRFRDAVMESIHESAGNQENPFAYISQRIWDKIKAEAGEG